MRRFTVVCTCDDPERKLRGLTMLQAVAHIGRHRAAVLMLDDLYDQLLAATLADAENALA